MFIHKYTLHSDMFMYIYIYVYVSLVSYAELVGGNRQSQTTNQKPFWELSAPKAAIPLGWETDEPSVIVVGQDDPNGLCRSHPHYPHVSIGFETANAHMMNHLLVLNAGNFREWSIVTINNHRIRPATHPLPNTSKISTVIPSQHRSIL